MLKNLPLMSPNMPDIFEIGVTIIISPVLRVNFVKIHTDSKVVLSMT